MAHYKRIISAKKGWEWISSVEVKYEKPVYIIPAPNMPLEILAQSGYIKSDSTVTLCLGAN